MLVLSRKKNEQIKIGDAITVTVVDVRGDKVRLGISAPRDTPVHRLEVYEAIQRELERGREETDNTEPDTEGGRSQGSGE